MERFFSRICGDELGMSISDFSPIKVREQIGNWLEEMACNVQKGRFRFCSKGSQVPTEGHSAQMATCFAMKIAWQTGIWEEWSESRRQACIDFVLSFQRDDGFFFDPWLERSSKLTWKHIAAVLIGRAPMSKFLDRKTRNLRAETRQSASSLLMVGSKPARPLPCEVASVEDIDSYISSFDWRFPWSAGSHLSHLMLILEVNRGIFGKDDNYDLLVDCMLEKLNEYYDTESGTWGIGNIPANIRINGAMKILSGLQWIDRRYPDITRLLDFALAQPFQYDGCGFLNQLFVVQQSRLGAPPGYRQIDMAALGERILYEVTKFKKPDGAFSFYTNRSQTSYYFARVSKGFPVSDLHGTVMLTWAIAIALDLLGDRAPRGSEKWRCQKP